MTLAVDVMTGATMETKASLRAVDSEKSSGALALTMHAFIAGSAGASAGNVIAGGAILARAKL